MTVLTNEELYEASLKVFEVALMHARNGEIDGFLDLTGSLNDLMRHERQRREMDRGPGTV